MNNEDKPTKKVEMINSESGEPCIELYLKESAKTLGIKVRQKSSKETQDIFDELYAKYEHLTKTPEKG